MSCGFYLHKGTLTFILWSLLNGNLFTLSVQILVTLSLFQLRSFHVGCPDPGHFVTFSTVTFSRCVSRSWSRHQKLCAGWRPVLPQLISIVSVVDFCSTSRFHIYIVCVDGSGSLSGGAFNQLKLVTLSIVLTILYLLKTVLQRSLLQCLNSLYKSDEVF